MKTIITRTFIAILLACVSISAIAQENTLDQSFKESTIERLCQLMNDYYVFPEVAKETENHLKKQLSNGEFNNINDVEAFAEALTKSVQSINHDKHMRIRPARKRVAPDNSPEGLTEDIIHNIQRRRRQAAGFHEVSRLEGNVGYIDLRGFAGTQIGIPMADSYMKLISDTDALIIDLRKNGGGSPSMVQYLCSYFFDDHRHLNSLYWREGDRTEEFWTLDEVGGKKLPDIPLVLLTSSYTFSGAEEFSYNMQTQKRATLVGETTGGGANPGGTIPINEKLSVFIPSGKAINPITKTNWEGVGVVPEIKTTPEEAYDKAVEIATAAAEKYRSEKKEAYTSLLSGMHTSFKNYKAGKADYQLVFEEIKKCNEAGLMSEGDINGLGYNFLMQKKSPKVAVAIFRSNTELYPNSANVFDSYGEGLATIGENEKAIAAYQEAVKLAEEHKDPNLELFRNNLKKVSNNHK